ncbi:MAG: hypothetical protein ACOYL5_07330 [Phototrophicaceae bacterium]|jgi:hypothetical protein
MTDNPNPLDRLVRIGWDALDAARRGEPMTIDRLRRNAQDALENARRSIFEEEALKEFHLQFPLDHAVSADVDLELSVGESHIHALSAEDRGQLLADAHLRYLGVLAFGVSGDIQRVMHIRQATPLTMGWANPVHWTTRPRWDVGLARRIPLSVRIQGGVGDANVNLDGLQVQSLRVEANIGGMNITLPADSPSFAGTLRGGAGVLALNVPQEASAAFAVRGGLGGIMVNIAAGAAVQVNVAGGTGQVEMMPGFSKIEAAAPGLPNTAVWQTPEFLGSARRVVINLSEGLFGNLAVRVLYP